MALGIDITKISRFEKYLNDEKFLNRVFTNKELNLIKNSSGKRKLELISGRFSAKESISKALGTGIRGFALKDIEILNSNTGKPMINLHNNAYEIWKNGDLNKLELSISHDGEYVVTTVSEYGKLLYSPPCLEMNKLLKNRKRDSHKGDYGKVALVGGSIGMCGSIYLSSIAALRTGSGLVYTVVPKEISQVLEIKSLENIVKPMDSNNLEENRGFFSKMDSFGIGPGMGEKIGYDLIEFFLKGYQSNFVIDADGLNIISKNLDKLPKEKNMVFTPHEMELSRLSGYSIEDIKKNREDIALEFARKLGIILVLKGNKTIVTNGEQIYINNTGNPGMATAGSGDVLTGVLTSLSGQGYSLYDATRLAVYIHGFAGDIAMKKIGEDGIIASDILENIPFAMKSIKENN